MDSNFDLQFFVRIDPDQKNNNVSPDKDNFNMTEYETSPNVVYPAIRNG